MANVARGDQGAGRRCSVAGASILLFAAVFTAHAAIACAVGSLGWDDGYITLAFARTFAETGHIGLTPYSETVEGATCPLWFLLLAGVCRLGVTGFDELHLASQLLAAVCAAGSAVLLYRLIRPTAPQFAWGISLLTAFLGPLRAETANGMEMTLLCVVVLGIMNSFRDGHEQPLFGISAFSLLVPWVRFEAAGYVIVGAIAIGVFSRRYRAGIAIVAACTASILVLAIARYMIFHAVLVPNTVRAKMLSPYSPPVGTLAWAYQLLQSLVLEPLATIIPALILGLFLLRVSGARAKSTLSSVFQLARSRKLGPAIGFGVTYCTAYLAFVLVVGSNYASAPGRMGMSAMLTLIAATALAIPVTQPIQRLKLRVKAAIAGFVLVPYLGVFAEDTSRIYVAHFPTGRIWAKTSIANHRRNAEAIDHVRELLGRTSISALIVEVGAASLCCQRIDVMDLGLLANSELTNGGWRTFPTYLASKRPDIIQPHGVFSQESGIYDDLYFTRHYTPVVIYDSLFYLRNDDYERLRGRCVKASTSQDYFYSGFNGLSSKRNARPSWSIDRYYINSLHLDSFCRLP